MGWRACGVALVLLVASLGACEGIAGYRDLRLGASGCTSVTLPASGAGRIRLVNAGTADGATDFCVRPSGARDWGAPLFAAGAPSCDTGLAYATATVPFAVPSGSVDVEAVPVGQPCGAASTSATLGIAVGDASAGAPVMTLMRYGGGAVGEAIAALPEDSQAEVGARPGNTDSVRVVDALSVARPIAWGFSTSAALPAVVGTPVATEPMTPGTATPATSTSPVATFDASGYANFLTTTFNLGAYYADDPARTALTLESVGHDSTATVYVIGNPGDPHNAHPLSALYCAETVAPDAAASAAGTSLLTSCQRAALPSFSVDLVSVSLYAVLATFEDQRRPYIYRDLAARPSDFMCVVEAGSLSDRRAIATAAAAPGGHFPYSFMITTDETTLPSNPADVPPPPSTAPCAAAGVDPSLVDGAYACAQQSCSSVPGGDPMGQGSVYPRPGCLSDQCTGAFLPLFTSPITPQTTPAEKATDTCFDCILWSMLSGDTWAANRDKCTARATRPFIYDGQTPLMILSRYPIAKTSVYELPATGYSRAILRAQLSIEDGKSIDFFCGALDYPGVDGQLPYTGLYGSDVAPDGGRGDGYTDENVLQAREAIAWLKSEIAADDLPAVLSIDLQSFDATGVPARADLVSSPWPQAYDLFLASGLTLVVGPNGPLCDDCSPPPGTSDATMHTFVAAFPPAATQMEASWGNDPTEVPIPPDVPGQPAPPGGTTALFERAAHNYTLQRPTQ